jgi:hypothetical protein
MHLRIAPLLAALSWFGIAAAQNQADIAYLQSGVREIAPDYYNGSLIVFGEQAFPSSGEPDASSKGARSSSVFKPLQRSPGDSAPQLIEARSRSRSIAAIAASTWPRAGDSLVTDSSKPDRGKYESARRHLYLLVTGVFSRKRISLVRPVRRKDAKTAWAWLITPVA